MASIADVVDSLTVYPIKIIERYLKYLNAQLVPKEEKKVPWIRRVINKVWKWGADR